jgi:hypothetical protein
MFVLFLLPIIVTSAYVFKRMTLKRVTLEYHQSAHDCLELVYDYNNQTETLFSIKDRLNLFIYNFNIIDDIVKKRVSISINDLDNGVKEFIVKEMGRNKITLHTIGETGFQ